MLHHRLQDVKKENFPWKYIAVLWHAEVHSPLTAAAHWTQLKPWTELTIIFSFKSELLLGKQRRRFISFWHSLSRENTRFLQVAMCSVVANVMASPLQREEGKSRTGQDWATSMPQGLMTQEMQESLWSGLQFYSEHQFLWSAWVIPC